MNHPPALVWFRRDFRLHDNEALAAACEVKRPMIPVFIWTPEDEEGEWAHGGASRWWMHHSLQVLQKELHKHHSRLIICRGDAEQELERLIDETGATAVFWNRLYNPLTIRRDTRIKDKLDRHGLEVKSFSGELLFEPTEVRNKQGEPFKVFTPFWKHLLTLEEPPGPLLIPPFKNPEDWPESQSLESLELLPKFDWAGGLRETWKPGEVGAHERLEEFLSDGLATYGSERNRPDLPGTSRLSPHLHHGEMTPRTIWHQVSHHMARNMSGEGKKSARAFLREIGWREFSYHMLFHFPETIDQPLRENFRSFPWQYDERKLRAWQKGQTGYPIVDAGMRELWHTGWMHNRVRMIVASFLVKDLMLPWQEGAAWFWDTLVDSDLASNTMGWQWAAGCGADAAPFFRIFNPMLQGKKFDPEGAYTRRWVPEIARLPDKHLFSPWEASEEQLEQAGVALGETYPHPLVDHFEMREQALAAFQKIK